MEQKNLRTITVLLFLAGLILPFSLLAEGGKELTPGTNGQTNYSQATPLNNTIGFLQNGDNNATNNYTGFFLYDNTTVGVFAGDPAYTPNHRLSIRISPGETLYYGLQRTDGVNAVTIVIKAMVGGVETILQSTTLASTNTIISAYTGAGRTVGILNCGQPGVICTRAEMNAGPSAIVGVSGYNALSVSLPGSVTAPTDMWVELRDDAGGVCVYNEKDVYDLWDFSVYSGTTEIKGRLHSKFWSFQAMSAPNRLSDNFILYPAIPNDAGTAYLIKGLNLRGMQAFGFSFVCNATGTLTNATGVPTPDFRERRKSKLNFSGIRTDIYPQYDIFVNDPDSLFWPTGSNAVPTLPSTINSWCADPATGRGSLVATILFLYPANVQIYGELNGVPGYQPLTADVLFEVNRSFGLGQIYWDGRDGLGNIVPSGTSIVVQYRIQRFPVHFPIYDPENNDLGYRIEDERPYATGTTGIAYWDDTNLVPGSSSLIGTTSASGVHPWGGGGTGINASNVGDINLMNTWSYGAEKEVTFVLNYVFKCDIDNDGSGNTNDIDDDDDGILDKDESNGVDPFLDSDGDGIVDYLDATYPGFADANFDGVNDNFDKDGDRVINELDLDSDNDGIPDVVEAYGVDADGDGRIDNYTDTDGDGLSENVDAAVGEPGSLGLGTPDLDGDGLPNYLDRDSDNDGIPDIMEAEGTDANNNGLVDQLNDVNGNGILDINPVLGESFADADFDGLCDAYDGDFNNDGVMENSAGALLRTGIDANNDGRADNFPYKNFDKEGRPDAYDLDSDNDGISDVREAGFADADNDGMSDGIKGTDGWDDTIDALASLVLTNTDGMTNPDYKDIDSDNDGVPDNVEGMSTAGYLLPANTDSDGDGLDDSYDATSGFGGNGNTPYDKDGDSTPDYKDSDTDNDGVIDLNEGNDLNMNGQIDDVIGLTSADTDGDGLLDFFDNDNSSTKGTSQYMGNSGTLTGDASPGSITTVQRNPTNSCGFERDWRCIMYVLPVNFLNFSARQEGANIQLRWQIEADEPILKTIIERSSDGRSFNQIGEVAMSAQAHGVLNGAFTDQSNTNGAKTYYRLYVLYGSGKTRRSTVVAISRKSQTDFKILQNPAPNGKIQIGINAAAAESLLINVMDEGGRRLITTTNLVSNGYNTINLNTASLSPGLYIIIIHTGQSFYTEKIIVK